MKVEKYKNLMVLMLLIFVGQVVSAPITTCKASNHLDSQSLSNFEMDVKDMASHDMSMMQSTHMNDYSNMECCGDDCDCPLGMCISMALYSNADIEVNLENLASQKTSEIPFVNNQYNSSIYRPPIFC